MQQLAAATDKVVLRFWGQLAQLSLSAICSESIRSFSNRHGEKLRIFPLLVQHRDKPVFELQIPHSDLLASKRVVKETYLPGQHGIPNPRAFCQGSIKRFYKATGGFDQNGMAHCDDRTHPFSQ